MSSLAYLGVVLWAAVGQVEVPRGFEVIPITVGPEYHIGVSMNECGEIVFCRGFSGPAVFNVVHYDNGVLTQLTDEGVRNVMPKINNLGAITWSHEVGPMGTPEQMEIIVQVYGVQIALGYGKKSDINDAMHLAWEQTDHWACGSPSIVYFFDGEEAHVILDDGLSSQSVRINAYDQVAWMRYDFPCGGGPFGWTSEIMHYSQGVLQTLPALGNGQVVDLNDVGQVVWQSASDSGVRDKVELWDKGETITLIDPGTGPSINNHGQVYFIRFDESVGAWQPWLYRTPPEDRFYRLLQDDVWNTNGDINDHGECAWMWIYGPQNFGGGVRYLRRIRNGDVDNDDDVDAADFAPLAGCMTGPKDTPRLCDCRFLDLDHDRDVDLADAADFFNRYGGVEISRDCCTAHDGPGCNDPAVEACVCSVRPDCCTDEWGDVCAAMAGAGCTVCP